MNFNCYDLRVRCFLKQGVLKQGVTFKKTFQKKKKKVSEKKLHV